MLKQFYKRASPKQIRFYEQVLYPLQDRVFEIAAVYEDKIYLTAGTALARFYFQHRFSDDLDFFTTNDDLKLIANDLIERLRQAGFSVDVERLETYFARFFVETKDAVLRTEFVREFHRWGDLAKTPQGIYINSLEDIGGNKVSAFEDRAEIKDIIDLYYISQSIPLSRLFEVADLKRQPVQYEALLAINAEGITGKVLTKKDVDEEKLSAFVQQLKEETESQIKKKEQAATKHLDAIIRRNLWDFPPDERKLSATSRPVLKRRLSKLPLPARRALEKALQSND